jgi:imidazolonepropionase-like amidohydrolase
MKKRSALLIFLLLISATRLHAQSSEQLTVIRAGSLIDGSNAAPRKNQLIFVRGNRVEKVSDASAQIPAAATVIDLSSATVLPGLIDSHTFSSGAKIPPKAATTPTF